MLLFCRCRLVGSFDKETAKGKKERRLIYAKKSSPNAIMMLCESVESCKIESLDKATARRLREATIATTASTTMTAHTAQATTMVLEDDVPELDESLAS